MTETVMGAGAMAPELGADRHIPPSFGPMALHFYVDGMDIPGTVLR